MCRLVRKIKEALAKTGVWSSSGGTPKPYVCRVAKRLYGLKLSNCPVRLPGSGLVAICTMKMKTAAAASVDSPFADSVFSELPDQNVSNDGLERRVGLIRTSGESGQVA